MMLTLAFLLRGRQGLQLNLAEWIVMAAPASSVRGSCDDPDCLARSIDSALVPKAARPESRSMAASLPAVISVRYLIDGVQSQGISSICRQTQIISDPLESRAVPKRMAQPSDLVTPRMAGIVAAFALCSPIQFQLLAPWDAKHI